MGPLFSTACFSACTRLLSVHPSSDWIRLILSQPFSYINTPTFTSLLFFLLTPRIKMEEIECSEMSEHKTQTLGNHQKERIQHSEQGESLKSRTYFFLIIELNRCPNFSKFYFWNEILHVLDSYSVHHQEFSTVHTAVVCVIQVC